MRKDKIKIDRDKPGKAKLRRSRGGDNLEIDIDMAIPENCILLMVQLDEPPTASEMRLVTVGGNDATVLDVQRFEQTVETEKSDQIADHAAGQSFAGRFLCVEITAVEADGLSPWPEHGEDGEDITPLFRDKFLCYDMIGGEVLAHMCPKNGEHSADHNKTTKVDAEIIIFKYDIENMIPWLEYKARMKADQDARQEEI